tara:strand:+ start:2785 stop:2979 length:195 start_codon:yes stop_codon:yes gene_type:complete
MSYIENLENNIDSLEYKIESMRNQIQLMYKYIEHLESAVVERRSFDEHEISGIKLDDWVPQENK